MYFTLPDTVALRSWQKVPRAYYCKNHPYAMPLSEREFAIMRLCDGEHDIEWDETVAALVMRRLIVSCDQGERPSAWSRYTHYDNRYFPKMNLMITGKCNYNCLHCFNAADNAPLTTEWSFPDLCDLFDQARDLGVYAFTITGGEPMMHRRFLDILREIHRRGMYVEELNTNGFFLTQQILDQMQQIGCRPLMKISFDGVGHHDWLRGRAGAEKITLDAMRLCIQNGFRVKAQTQVHRFNADSMLPTAELLNGMGVCEMRIIRTTEVPRWAVNAGDATLSFPEYYRVMLDFARAYRASGMQMDIDVWQMLRLYPGRGSFTVVPVLCAEGEYRPTIPVCRGNRGMIAVSSSGDVMPCLQISGVLMDHGIHLGNLHRSRLKDLIREGPYMDAVCATVDDVRQRSEKCAACKWFPYCTGGCRVLAMIFSGQKADYYGEDRAKCMFFEGGWYEKTVEALSGWKNNSPIGTGTPGSGRVSAARRSVSPDGETTAVDSNGKKTEKTSENM